MRTFSDAAALRTARLANLKMRDRDFARIHEASEGELVAAFVGHGNVRLDVDLPTFLPRISELGTVMALTRNEAAVHEKIGEYSKVSGKDTMLVLDPNIDLRIFTSHWKYAFAVVSNDGETTKRSFQLTLPPSFIQF
jgi:putative hemin transport protein